MSDERRPTINIYASKHRGKTAESKRREVQSERDRKHESSQWVNGWRYTVARDVWDFMDDGVVRHTFTGSAVRAEMERTGRSGCWALAWMLDHRYPQVSVVNGEA